MDDDGLIAASLGQYDAAEYERQLEHGVERRTFRPTMPSRQVVYHPASDKAFAARVEQTVPIMAKATNEELEPIILILRHTTNPQATVVMGTDRIDVFRDEAAFRGLVENRERV